MVSYKKRDTQDAHTISHPWLRGRFAPIVLGARAQCASFHQTASNRAWQVAHSGMSEGMAGISNIRTNVYKVSVRVTLTPCI